MSRVKSLTKEDREMKTFRVIVNGSEYKVEIEELQEDGASAPAPAAPPAPKPAPQPASSPKPAAPAQPTAAGSAGGAIVAPMPGTILRVDAEIGSTVIKGQTLLVLEAMKMENDIQAPSDGVVQELNVTQGVSVNAGDVLIVLSS
jgi:biotin carboxyl carrier protein